jgi:uncharacterized membrane protein
MMSENKNRQLSGRMKFSGIGLAIGLVFGGLVGVLIGNPIIFAGGTMVLGFAIGAALDRRRSSNDS